MELGKEGGSRFQLLFFYLTNFVISIGGQQVKKILMKQFWIFHLSPNKQTI